MNEFLESLRVLVALEAKLLWKLPSSLPRLWPSLAQSHPQWPSMGMPQEEAGWGCQQHSTVPTDRRNKRQGKVEEWKKRRDGRRGRLWVSAGEAGDWARGRKIREKMCTEKREGGKKRYACVRGEGGSGVEHPTPAPVLTQHCPQTSVTSHYCWNWKWIWKHVMKSIRLQGVLYSTDLKFRGRKEVKPLNHLTYIA